MCCAPEAPALECGIARLHDSGRRVMLLDPGPMDIDQHLPMQRQAVFDVMLVVSKLVLWASVLVGVFDHHANQNRTVHRHNGRTSLARNWHQSRRLSHQSSAVASSQCGSGVGASQRYCSASCQPAQSKKEKVLRHRHQGCVGVRQLHAQRRDQSAVLAVLP